MNKQSAKNKMNKVMNDFKKTYPKLKKTKKGYYKNTPKERLYNRVGLPLGTKRITPTIKRSLRAKQYRLNNKSRRISKYSKLPKENNYNTRREYLIAKSKYSPKNPIALPLNSKKNSKKNSITRSNNNNYNYNYNNYNNYYNNNNNSRKLPSTFRFSGADSNNSGNNSNYYKGNEWGLKEYNKYGKKINWRL